MNPSTSALLTDLYELEMVQAYREEGMDECAAFELFVRKLPPHRNFLVSAGLEQVLDFLSELHVTPEELAWLDQTGLFTPALLRYLETLRFSGDVEAIEEGTIFFPHEPILRIVAPLPLAQLVESRIMNLLHFQTMVASKAVRSVLVSGGKPIIDFGLRRAHGAPAAQILRIVADFEAYPQWNEEVTGCWILHRYDDGRPSQLRLDTKIQGMHGSYIQAVYYPGVGQIQTVMQQGNLFSKQEQLFSVVDLGASALLTVDRPPVAGDFAVGGIADQPVWFALNLLSYVVTDPDGDAVQLSGFTTPTAQGGPVTATASYLVYTPPPGYAGNDDFTYTVWDGRAGLDDQRAFQVGLQAGHLHAQFTAQFD